jgi:hypothetical protein
MTTFQTGSRVLVNVRRETTFGVQATATGASTMRIIGGNGMQLNYAQVQSVEKLANALTSMGRLGYKSATGDFEKELSVGGVTDIEVEAVMRSAWATSTNAAFSGFTTVAVASNALTAAAGSFLSTLKTGDIFTLSGTSQSANNSRNIRALAVTTLTISVATGTFTAVAASATGTLTALKKITTAATPTRYSHTIEQYDTDITAGEIFLGCRCVGLDLSFKPGQMAKLTSHYMGVDRTTESGSSYFTTPSLTTSIGLVADDSTIRYNGVDVAKFTGFDLKFAITAAGVPIIGSRVTPDIFDNNLAVSGTITSLRSDFSNLTLLDAETEFEVQIVLQEPTGSPPACFAIYLPRVKIADLSATPVGGGDGAKSETLTLMVGPKTADSTHDGGIATFYSSAA